MPTSKQWNCLIAAWLIIIVSLAIRLVLAPHFLLVPDEANYWQWSRHLALGYHDHPPMIAWTIWLAGRVFGQSEFAVRLPTILGLGLASVYLFFLAGRWFSCRCGFHAILLMQGILLFNGAALIATPDGLLLPCWAAATYHAAVAWERRSNTGLHWLACGLWFGIGLLSKYTMLLFLPSLFFFLLSNRQGRRALASPWPWLGLLAGFACFTPVVLWNADNGWATFRHVLYQGGLDNRSFFTLRYIGDFLGGQALLLSPLVFVMICMAWLGFGKSSLRTSLDTSFLRILSATTFAIFLLLSLHVRIYGNWPAPAYLTAIILVAALYSPARNNGTARPARFWQASVILAYLITLPLLIHLVYPILPLPVRLDRIAKETVGWDQLGTRISQEKAAMPRPEQTFIFGLRYQYASELAFYTPGQPETVSINRWARPNVYDYWTNEHDLIGKDGIGVYEWQGMAERIARLFDRVDPPETVTLYRDSPWFGRQAVQTLYIIRGYGFKGGLHWQPQNASDIRATRQVTDGQKKSNQETLRTRKTTP